MAVVTINRMDPVVAACGLTDSELATLALGRAARAEDLVIVIVDPGVQPQTPSAEPGPRYERQVKERK